MCRGSRMPMVVQRILVVFIVSNLTLGSYAQQRQGLRLRRKAQLIGTIRRVAENCGCVFAISRRDLRSQRYVFFEDTDVGPTMNLDGQTVKLTTMSNSEPEGGVTRKGQRFTRIYAADQIKVRMTFTATRVCPATYDRECLGNSYNVMITATKSDRSQTITATGGCGC